jgi:hypothetical protein
MPSVHISDLPASRRDGQQEVRKPNPRVNLHSLPWRAQRPNAGNCAHRKSHRISIGSNHSNVWQLTTARLLRCPGTSRQSSYVSKRSPKAVPEHGSGRFRSPTLTAQKFRRANQLPVRRVGVAGPTIGARDAGLAAGGLADASGEVCHGNVCPCVRFVA